MSVPGSRKRHKTAFDPSEGFLPGLEFSKTKAPPTVVATVAQRAEGWWVVASKYVLKSMITL